MCHVLPILASAFFSLGCLGQSPASPASRAAEKQPAPCTVSGRVVTATDGLPLKSARVGLAEDVSPHPHVFAAYTDSDGRFAIEKITPGRYRFSVSHAGYISQQFRSKRAGEPGAVLALSPGQEVTDVLFRLIRAAVITGRIVDANGEPMTGVTVTVLRKPNADEREEFGPGANRVQVVDSAETVTDDRGEYRVFGLVPGDYYIKARESGDSPVRQHYPNAVDTRVLEELGSPYASMFYPGVLHLEQAEPTGLRAGEEMQADFSMRRVKTQEVSGKVIAAGGGPATDARVMVLDPDNPDFNDLTVSTDAKGEFTLHGVPPGSYLIRAQQFDQEKHYQAGQKLVVGDEKLESVTLALGRGSIIYGHVRSLGAGSKLDHVLVELESTEDSPAESVDWAEIKKDGSFQFLDVADGSYALNLVGLENTWYVKSGRLGTDDVLQKGIQVEKESAPGQLEVTISSVGAQLEGIVTDQDKPVAAAQVRARPDPETAFNRTRSKTTITDQNGHFTLTSLAAGKYRVIAKLPAASADIPSVTSEPTAVTLGEGEHQQISIAFATPRN